MNEKATWQRPKTIRRYLHPAASERLFTLWVEGKLVFGEVNVKDFVFGSSYGDGRKYYFDLQSAIVWLLYGKDSQQLDFKNAKNIITDDGTPIHGLQYDIDNQTISIEAFCNSQRKSTCFEKISLKNNTNEIVKDTITLMLRSGKESELVFGTPNGYKRHEPNPDIQKSMISTWIKNENIYSDGIRVLNLKTDIENTFDSEKGIISFNYVLYPNETKEIYFSLDMGETKDFNYNEEKIKTINYWQNELSNINKLPFELKSDKEKLKMIRHMATILLQTFAYPIGEDYLVSRQGGMMSICWPSEAISTIEALTKIGDFSKYIEPVLDNHLNNMQKESGEIENVGAYWASVTASVIFSFCKYANTKDISYYAKNINKVIKSYKWLINTRKNVLDNDKIAGGLFPPQISNDWGACMQGWTLTDVFNIFAIDELSKTCKKFNDIRYQEIENERNLYIEDMKRHFKKFLDIYKDKDELKIPLMPVDDDQNLIDGGFPLIYHGRFILSGVIDNEDDIRRVYKYMLNHGICKDGLYGYMPYPNGNRHIWYMSFPDYYWHIIWTKLGEKQLAKQILDNQFKYAMSDEYYMQERYEDNSPYYVPWSPNASATGRTILMLLGELNNYDEYHYSWEK